VGAGATVHLAPGAVTFNALMSADAGVDAGWGALTGATKDKLAGRVPGRAVAGARMSTNIPATLDGLMSDATVREEMREAYRAVRTEVGVDLETDVIPFLGSPISAAVFDSEVGAEVPYGFAFWIPLNSGHDLDGVLRQVRRSMEDEGVRPVTDTIDGAEWTTVSEGSAALGWAVVRDHFVFVFGRSLLDEVSRGVGGGGGSFVDGVDRSLKAGILDGPAGMMWIDMQEIVRSPLGDMLKEDRDFRDIWPMLEATRSITYTTDWTTRQVLATLTLTATTEDGYKTAVFNQDRMSARRLRAMRAEAPTNLDGIRTAEKAYHAEWDAFTTAMWTPSAVSGQAQVGFSGGGYRSFENLGGGADGKVRCRYRVDAQNRRRSYDDDFVAIAECDLDGDGVYAVYRANRAQKATMITPIDVY